MRRVRLLTKTISVDLWSPSSKRPHSLSLWFVSTRVSVKWLILPKITSKYLIYKTRVRSWGCVYGVIRGVHPIKTVKRSLTGRIHFFEILILVSKTCLCLVFSVRCHFLVWVSRGVLCFLQRYVTKSRCKYLYSSDSSL